MIAIDQEQAMISFAGKAWVKIKLRKATSCCITGDIMNVGEEAFRPLSNSTDRMQRMSVKAAMRKDRFET